MMNKKISWVFVLSTALMAGCGKQIPKHVLQPSEMESILYDYHLGKTMSNDLSYSENYKKAAYQTYIFEKHHITEAKFDSSMAWYARHTEELTRIYTRLGKRFREDKLGVQQLLDKRGNKLQHSLPGDTVNVWSADKLYWLTDAPLTNKLLFTIPTDSNFKAKDAFLWSADYIFLTEGEQRATMGINILFENDSVAGLVKDITRSGTETLYIKPDSAYAIKSVNGFIYYAVDSVRQPGVIVNHIALTRYHEMAADSVAVDSLATDSLAADSLAADSLHIDTVKVDAGVQQDSLPTRLNPREMRDNNAVTHPKRTRPRRM